MGDSLNLEKQVKIGGLRYGFLIFYDLLLLFGVLFFAGAIAYPLTHAVISPTYQISPLYDIYLLMVCFLYFAWPWLHGGQTLPMQAWRIQLQSTDGKAVTWRQAALRFSMAIISWLALGIGFFRAIVDKEHGTWHDEVSGTRLVLLPKKKKKAK